MSKYTRAFKVARSYLNNQYILLDNHGYGFFDHEHICFPLRLLGKDFELVCPHYRSKYFDEPEHSDCCDECKYLGIINFDTDKNNKKNISFVMDESIAKHFESIGD